MGLLDHAFFEWTVLSQLLDLLNFLMLLFPILLMELEQ